MIEHIAGRQYRCIRKEHPAARKAEAGMCVSFTTGDRGGLYTLRYHDGAEMRLPGEDVMEVR